jgi:ATP-dependent Lon protease
MIHSKDLEKVLFVVLGGSNGGDDTEHDSDVDSDAGSDTSNDQTGAADTAERPMKRKREHSTVHPMVTRSQSRNPDQRPADESNTRNPEEKNYSHDEWKYYKGLSTRSKNAIAAIENVIRQHGHRDVPLRFRMLQSGMPNDVKALAVKKCSMLVFMHTSTGEYSKLNNWLDMLSNIPFGVNLPMPVSLTTPPQQLSSFLKSVQDTLENAVYGHDEVKKEIVNFVAQKITNPISNGRVLCLVGSPGVAKTHMVREGICRALNLPFSMIALGGANDGSFLDGHGFTYEGSRPGIIVQEIIRAKCMNPVIFFDELDKVAQNYRGEEVYNVLLHVTDPSQNDAFRDKYFSDVPIDISKAFLVFSCNDISKVNRILRDRLTVLHMRKYDVNDKIQIVRAHILKDICRDFCFDVADIDVADDVLSYIISLIDDEDGVRALKRALHCLISSINTLQLLNESGEYRTPPYVITRDSVDKLLTVSYKKQEDDMCLSAKMMYV